jgi:hypothetical protein
MKKRTILTRDIPRATTHSNRYIGFNRRAISLFKINKFKYAKIECVDNAAGILHVSLSNKCHDGFYCIINSDGMLKVWAKYLIETLPLNFKEYGQSYTIVESEINGTTTLILTPETIYERKVCRLGIKHSKPKRAVLNSKRYMIFSRTASNSLGMRDYNFAHINCVDAENGIVHIVPTNTKSVGVVTIKEYKDELFYILVVSMVDNYGLNYLEFCYPYSVEAVEIDGVLTWVLTPEKIYKRRKNRSRFE